jgi:hypothetical protein
VGRRSDRGRVEVLSFHTIACEETVRQGTPARLVAWADYAPAAIARWAALAGSVAVLGVDAITTDRPAALHHQLAATSQPA